MRKRELIHTHALLDRVATYLATEGALTEDGLSEYRALDVSPTAVYRSKQQHDEAVRTLASAIADGLANGTRATGENGGHEAVDHTDTDPPLSAR